MVETFDDYETFINFLMEKLVSAGHMSEEVAYAHEKYDQSLDFIVDVDGDPTRYAYALANLAGYTLSYDDASGVVTLTP